MPAGLLRLCTPPAGTWTVRVCSITMRWDRASDSLRAPVNCGILHC